MWYKLAEELHMSPQRAKQEHTSMEFMCWCVRREQRMNEPTIDQQYMAAITTMIEMANSKDPSKVKHENHILKFVPPKQQSEEEQIAELEAKVEKSKSAWGAFTGASNDHVGNTGSETDDRSERIGHRNGSC